MSDSVQLMPATDAGAASSALKSAVSGKNTAQTAENGESPAGFTAVFASYLQSEPEATSVPIDEELVAMLAAMLPPEMLQEGKMLPQEDLDAIWQAYLQLNPDQSNISKSVTLPIADSVDVLDSKKQPVLTPPFPRNQLSATISTNPDVIENAATKNNQFLLAAAKASAMNFQPEANQALLLNTNDQFTPVQANNSMLSGSLAAVGLGTATQAAATQTLMAPLNLGQAGWDANLANRLQMMVGQNVQTAEIRLDPPELGMLDIKVKVTNDTASVSFTSQHAHVKDAIELAVPRLREMFAESGLSLGDVNVQQESFAQSQQHAEEEGTGNESFSTSTVGNEDENTINRKIVSNNLLDAYA